MQTKHTLCVYTGPSAPPPEPCPEGIRGFDCEDGARNTRTFGTIEDGMVGCVTETVTQEVENSGDAEVHAKASTLCGL